MRPRGVTLVAFYQTLRGLIGLVFGLFILFYKGPANQFVSRASEGNAVERFVGTFGHAAGVVIIVFALVHIVAGYGVFRVLNWGRLLTLLFSAIELVLVLPGATHANLFSLCFGVLNALSIFYLAMPAVRRSFRAESNQLRMAV
jgi:hypothetical protein